MDWKSFLEDHHIFYVDSGKNVAHGNLNIACPFCGSSDPSQHMGINLSTGDWGCWRDSTHRGRKPHRLIMSVLGCSYGQAIRQVLTYRFRVVDLHEGGVADEVEKLFSEQIVNTDPADVVLPSEFRYLGDGREAGTKFKSYLMDRGFSKGLDDLISLYHLHYSITGDYTSRVILPLYIENKLVAWTGRSISSGESLRYKSSASSKNMISLKDMVFSPTGILDGGKALFVTEGPFDAMKVDFYGRGLGIRATCVFGVGVTEEQKWMLREFFPLFEKSFIMFDPGASVQAEELRQEYSDVKNLSLFEVGSYASDPGELSPEMVEAIALTV